MEEKKKNQLKTFSLFEGSDVLIMNTIRNITFKDYPHKADEAVISLDRLLDQGLCGSSGGGMYREWRLLENGRDLWKELKEEKRIEDEQIELTRKLNQSVIDTNNASIKLSNKTKGIYAFQKWTTVLTMLVAFFASWIAYQQKIRDDLRDAREQLKEQNTKQIQSQIQALNLSLDSMRDFQNAGIAKATNDSSIKKP